MKKGILIVLCGLFILCGISGRPVNAVILSPSVGISAGTPAGYFYDALSPYGNWVWVDAYGWVWYPYNMEINWRPYTHGHWVYTEYGWTWVSDYDWGWACFHYGRWSYDNYYGWIWCPDTVWGPAWVCWRTGSDYIGWAPLPPGVIWNFGIGFSDYDWDEIIPSFGFCFVRHRDFDRHDVDNCIELAARNVTIMRDSPVHMFYRNTNGRIVNGLYGQKALAKEIGHSFTRIKLTEAGSPGDARITGSEARLFKPDLRTADGRNKMNIFREAPQTNKPQELTQKHEQENQALQTLHQNRQNTLQQQHQAEIQQPSEGISQEQLQQKHAAENKALQEQENREKQLLSNQQQIEHRAVTAPNAPSSSQHYNVQKSGEGERAGNISGGRSGSGGGSGRSEGGGSSGRQENSGGGGRNR